MPLRDPKHLAFIRSLSCVKCGCFGCQACHIRKFGDGGTGLKPSDDRVLPMCHGCHSRQHQIGEVSFFSDVWAAIELAKSLYLLSGDRVNALGLISRKRQELFK